MTSPSNSPENPPKAEGYKHFFDEVTAMYYFTTICAGAAIDMQILDDLFGYFITASALVGETDTAMVDDVSAKRARLVPWQIGSGGALQEWAEDYVRHFPAHFPPF